MAPEDQQSSAPFGRGRVRRLFGLDRSGPPPSQTQKGAPLNPWTIPNFVGYARLAAIPLFLYLAFESGDGRSAGAAIVFWLIAAGDYVDGWVPEALLVLGVALAIVATVLYARTGIAEARRARVV